MVCNEDRWCREGACGSKSERIRLANGRSRSARSTASTRAVIPRVDEVERSTRLALSIELDVRNAKMLYESLRHDHDFAVMLCRGVQNVLRLRAAF